MSMRNLLSAAGLAVACLMGAPGGATAMTFERITTSAACHASTCVLASGEIDRDTAAHFKAFIRFHGVQPGSVVVFDSSGGVLLQSLALGEAIRAARLYTTVGRYDRATHRFVTGAECVSACAYAFLGGVEREVAEHARLGVHQFSWEASDEPELSISDAQSLMGLIQIYTEKMLGAAAVVTLAARTRPQDTYWLSQPELRKYRVVTRRLGGAKGHYHAGVEIEHDWLDEGGMQRVAVSPADTGDLAAGSDGLGAESHIHVLGVRR